MGDKAYSSAANRSYLRKRRIKAVIPVKEDQKNHRRNRGSQGGRPPAFDAEQYKERNTAGRCFGKLKQFRAVRPATTSASSCTRAPSTWRQSGPGYEIRSHDPRDTL
jgi:transposase